MKIGRRQFITTTTTGAGIAALGGVKPAIAQTEDKGNAFRIPLEKPLTFAVVADPHASEDPKKGIESHGNAVKKFLACVHDMENRNGPGRPDFLLLAGDIHFWALEEHLASITIPIHAVAGNHEGNAEKRKQIRNLFPGDFKQGGRDSDYYSFAHSGVRFIGLCNAGMGGEHVGQLCSENIVPRGQCEWLEDQLAMPEERKVVFAHIPPEPEGKDRNMYLSRNDSRWFNELVRKTKPGAMFFGHVHKETEEYRIGETRCFNVRSCCWNFGEADLGYMLVHMNQDGLEVEEVTTGRYS